MQLWTSTWWVQKKDTQAFQLEGPQVPVTSAFAQKSRAIPNCWYLEVSGEDHESLSPEDLVPDPEEHEDEGSNLVDSRPSVVFREPILLDLSRELVEAEVFDSYTYTGVIEFRGFFLLNICFNSCYNEYCYISRNFIIFD